MFLSEETMNLFVKNICTYTKFLSKQIITIIHSDLNIIFSQLHITHHFLNNNDLTNDNYYNKVPINNKH